MTEAGPTNAAPLALAAARGYFDGVVLPTLLLSIAVLAGAIVAYGTHPMWASYPHGMDLILFARRHEWPIAAVSVLLCIVVIGLVVSGKRRAWWLLGLAPVLALFGHRFYTDPLRDLRVVEDPAFVSAQQAGFLSGDDYVVGIVFNESAYAYPYSVLYRSPVVFQADREKRMVLIWSAFANRAVACHITRELRARDLEIVSMPANALLLYNSRLGEFINGITALTPSGARPVGIGSSMPAEKLKWSQWRALHPATTVMAPRDGVERAAAAPLLPWFAEPRLAGTTPASTPIVLVPTTQPVAMRCDAITPRPINVSAGSLPLLIVRDPVNGRVRAFDRRVDERPATFRPNTNARRKVQFIDVESNSGWSADGRAVDGLFGRQHKRLNPVVVDENLYWGTMKTWMPDLTLLEAAELPGSSGGRAP